MKAEDIIRRRIREALNEQKERLLRSLRKLDIRERADIEPFIDEMQRQAWQAQLKQKSWLNLEENYSKHELGLRRVLEVDTCSDKGGDECQINKAIQKAAAVSDKTSGKKPRKARQMLEAFASAGYYGYLVLRKKLGIPCEHPVLGPWHAKFLPWIPSLINPGGIVFLKEGTYSITSSILISASNITLEGVGYATLINTPGMGDSFIVIGGTTNAERVIVRNLRIDGTNQTAPSAYGIENDKNGCGILFDGDINQGVSTKYGIVEGCYIQKCANEGLAGYFAAGVSFTEYHFWHMNHLVDNVYRHIHSHGDSAEIITNNILIGGPAGTFDTGIRHGQVICDNAFYNVAYRGIYGAYGTIIANNVFVDKVGGYCIESWGQDIIAYNHIYRGSQTAAIYIKDNFIDAIGNRIVGADKAGIYVASSSNCKILNNIFWNIGKAANNTYDCILIGGASNNNLVAFNYMHSTATNKPRYGVFIDATAGGTPDKNKILYNYIEGMATAAFADEGTNTLVRNNFGFSNIKTVSADYTMSWVDETILADASGGAITVTLPDPAAYPNYEVMIKKVDSSTNAVTVAPHGTETIDGASSLTLQNQNDAKRLRSDGTNWYSF